MNKEQFIKFFQCFTDAAGNSIGKGNLDKAFIEAEYKSFQDQIPMEAICQKWKMYIDECIANKTPDKFIKTMESFIKSGDYKTDYGASLKSKQSSFMDKYKTKPKEANPLVQYVIDMEEGQFSMNEEDGEKERKEFLDMLQKNKLKFFQEYHFVIKEEGKDFIKIIL